MPDELSEFPEPLPVPAWDDPTLHHQADECIAWMLRAIRAAGWDDEVFVRREGSAYEMGRLVERLDTHMRRVRREVPPGVVWTCRQRLGMVGVTERQRWMSALVLAYHVAVRTEGQSAAAEV